MSVALGNPWFRWVAVVMLFPWLVSTPASTTVCSRPSIEQVLESDVVVLGELLESHRTVRPGACVSEAVAAIRRGPWTEAECLPCKMGFKVIESLKGGADGIVWVDLLGAPNCPSPEEMKRWVPDLKMLVFPYRTKHHFAAVNVCWGLNVDKDLPEFLEQLRRAIDAGEVGPR